MCVNGVEPLRNIDWPTVPRNDQAAESGEIQNCLVTRKCAQLTGAPYPLWLTNAGEAELQQIYQFRTLVQ